MRLSQDALPCLVQNLISRFRRSSPAMAATQALLDQDEIMALFYRAREQAGRPSVQQDVAHRMLGDSRSVYRGFGLDYEESRAYQSGDELRFMNWRVTARTGELYMKVFREERKPGVFILVDRRRSMRFGTRHRLKVSQAVRAAAMAAFWAQQQNMQISGVVLEETPRWLGESNDPQASFNLVNAAASSCPPCLHSIDEPSLVSVIKRLQAMLDKGTQVYLVSDFHDLDESARPVLLNLAREHQVIGVHIVDAAELQLPVAGKLQMYSPDAQQSQLIDSSDPTVRKDFEKHAVSLLTQRQQLFTSLGLPYLRLPADEDGIEQMVL